MAKTNTDREYLPPPPSKKSSSLGFLFYPLVFCTVACDLLGLCHLVPTHSQHLTRPYMLSMVPFKVFRN